MTRFGILLPLSNRTLFIFCTCVNLLNFIDRGIIPGGSDQFNAFITNKLNADGSKEDFRPDVYLGMLQSAFVAGFSVSCVISAHLLHRVMFTKLMGFSLLVWLVSIIGSGLAGEWGGSYWLRLGARCLSGVAEASFQCIVPPLIQDRCAEEKEITDRRNSMFMKEDLSTGKLSSVEEEEKERNSSKLSFDTVSVTSGGDAQNVSTSSSSSVMPKPAVDSTSMWLAIYFTAIPTGTALGYIFSSAVSSSALGWQAAFYIEGLAMVPLVLFCVLLHYSEKTRVDRRMSRKGLSEPLIGRGEAGGVTGVGGGNITQSSVQYPKDRRLSRLLEPVEDLTGLSKKVTMIDEFYACVSSLPFMSVLFSYAGE